MQANKGPHGNLEERWRMLFNGCPAGPEEAGREFERLYSMYSEGHRRYHTARHVAECMEELDISRHLSEHPSELEIGLLGHDAVYRPREHDNERQSADYMKGVLSRLGCRGYSIERTERIILVTDHITKPEGIDEMLAVDIDKSILGKPEDAFMEYDKGVKEEYSWYSPKKYLIRRMRFLNSLISNKPIYHTEFFSQRYEEHAEKNLRRVIRMMEEELYG